MLLYIAKDLNKDGEFLSVSPAFFLNLNVVDPDTDPIWIRIHNTAWNEVLLAHLNLTVLTFIQVEMEGLAVEKKKGGGGVFKKGQKKKKRKLDDDDSDQCSVVGDSAFDSGLLGAG